MPLLASERLVDTPRRALIRAPHDQIAHVVAALLAFRAIYHLLPFVLGCALLATVESGRPTHGGHA
jgi:uncharacterized membrane protein YbhN (UPF0104 family)